MNRSESCIAVITVSVATARKMLKNDFGYNDIPDDEIIGYDILWIPEWDWNGEEWNELDKSEMVRRIKYWPYYVAGQEHLIPDMIIKPEVGSDEWCFDLATEGLWKYLTAEYGQKLVVDEDRPYRAYIMDQGSTSREEIVVVKCSGLANMDTSWFTEDFVYENENGEYVNIKTGEVVGDLEDVVRDCIENGDVSYCIDDLAEKIKQSYLEGMAI